MRRAVASLSSGSSRWGVAQVTSALLLRGPVSTSSAASIPGAVAEIVHLGVFTLRWVAVGLPSAGPSRLGVFFRRLPGR